MEYAFLTSALVTGAAIMLLRPVAPHIRLVDQPSARKAHHGAVPLVGGLAIFAALVPLLVVAGPVANGAALLAGGILLVVVGAVDDAHHVGPKTRLAVQGTAILILALYGGTILESLGNLGLGGAEVRTGWLALGFTVFAGLGLINAVNMADGVDGLSGMLSMITLAALAIVAFVAGRADELLIIAVLSGALAGFLAFNLRLPGRRQALVFLGDAGSYLVGFLIFYLLVRLSQGPQPAMSPVTALWITLVPLFDTVGMMLRRLRKGRSPFRADREHLHHIFLLAGFTPNETVATLTTAAGLAATIGLAGLYLGVPDAVMLVLFLILAAGYYGAIMRAWTVMRFLSRSICRRDIARDRRSGGDRRHRHVPEIVAVVGEDRRAGDERRRDIDRRTNPPTGLEGGPPEPSIARCEQVEEEPARPTHSTT
jgi:UDP-GlcNAc:undecaprenyl-phosphate GlcNAc-1-phosphate transferase